MMWILLKARELGELGYYLFPNYLDTSMSQRTKTMPVNLLKPNMNQNLMTTEFINFSLI